jgi:2-methylcitrate dehydratase PrpD
MTSEATSAQPAPTRAADTVATDPRQVLQGALGELGAYVAGFELEDLDPPTRAALDLVLLDTIGAMVAGAETPEARALLESFGQTGPARPRGTARYLPVSDCAFFDGTAACILELDEGNKHARGHPAAHVLPVVLALGAATGSSACEMVAAFAAGHEVAARFGRAVRLRPGFHPHGNWGVAGAAAAAARLLGADAHQVAGAIDAAAGMALASPFDAALEGTFVRNTYLGMTAVAGLQAARLSVAGLTTPAGTAQGVFGELVGAFDPRPLTEELGTRHDIALGYLKRHASCSYTHPPVDAVLELRAREDVDPQDVVDVEVRTHGLAVPLDRRRPASRLAAMFSIPHLVAAALLRGRIDVEATGDEAREDPRYLALAERVRLVHDAAMDARAPQERPARITLTSSDGTVHTLEVPNPVGDADHHPLGRDEVSAKLTVLIGAERVGRIEHAIAALHDHDLPATELLDRLP